MCIFQGSEANNYYSYMRCFYIPIIPTTDAQDGKPACSSGQDDKCLSLLPGAKMNNGYFDFLVLEHVLPAQDTEMIHELGQIAWDLVIPAHTDEETVTLTVSCASNDYFYSSTWGQDGDANRISVSTVLEMSNGYTEAPALSISGHDATLTYATEMP